MKKEETVVIDFTEIYGNVTSKQAHRWAVYFEEYKDRHVWLREINNNNSLVVMLNDVSEDDIRQEILHAVKNIETCGCCHTLHPKGELFNYNMIVNDAQRYVCLKCWKVLPDMERRVMAEKLIQSNIK